jgi:hypothetical protein
VHRHNIIPLSHGSTPDSPQLLHVPSNTQQQSQVNAECSDVGSRLARNPKDAEVTVVVEFDELALVDRADSELTLDGRDEGRTLKKGAGESFEAASKGFLAGESGVEANDADVFLSCSARETTRSA